MTILDWDDLRIFLAVVRAGSVRKAAKQVGKTHATVSRHIRTLQEALGNPVLERRQEGQCLTELGARILPLAEQIEENAATIDRAAFSADTGLAGPVKLSLSESLYIALLHQPLDDFMQRYPMIELHVTATDDLVQLAKRDADVILRITTSPPEAAFGKKLADSPLAVYASPVYLRTRPDIDRWVALDYEPCRVPPLPARVVANVDTPALAAKMIAMGRGIGMLPCYLGDTDKELIRVKGMKMTPDMQIWGLTHSDLRPNPRVRALMDHLYESFEKLRPLIEGKMPN